MTEVSGRFLIAFFPGDAGPFGQVSEPGLLLAVAGQQQFTIDPETFAISSYSVDGELLDLCAALSDGV